MSVKSKNLLPCVSVIIAAAGSGTRLGGLSKALLKIDGKYTFLYSLDMFIESEYVKRVVISAKKEDINAIREIVARQNYMKEVLVVEGGSTRQESVTLAFRAAFNKKSKTQFVAVHDAARPLITRDGFEKAMRIATKYGCAVCAAKAKDTFKRSDENFLIRENVDRENLWHIQTPQIFDTDMFHTAIAKSAKENTCATDESTLVTDAGFLVKLSDTGHDNIKITYPEDVLIAEAILKKRKLTEEYK